MRLESDGRSIRHATLAALIGAAVGAGAGVYSLGRAIAPADETAPPAAMSTVRSPLPPSRPSPPIESQPGPTESTPVATNGVVPRPRQDPPSPPPDEPPRRTADTPSDSPTAVLARARSLADRQDVIGLMALRDIVVRAAQHRGDVDSAGVQSVLEQVDQRLGEARMMRLKSDAEQFRKAAAAKELR